VSLISEALRKARQTTSEREAEQRAGIYRWALPPRSRRPRTSARLALGAAIGIAIGLAGAFAAWLVLEARPETTSRPQVATQARPVIPQVLEAEETQLRPPEITAPTSSRSSLGEGSSAGPPHRHEPTMESRARDPGPAAMSAGPANAPAALPDPARQVEGRPAPAGTAERAHEVPSEPEHRAEAPPPAAAADPAPTPEPGNGERVFVLDADLGHVTLSLDFIVFRSVDPFAEINGIEVRKGSLVEGFRVEALEADRVVLRDAVGPLVLRIP